MDYATFLQSKVRMHASSGIDDTWANTASLFDFQAVLVKWALRKGRAALFEDTGLGKSRQQIVWADAIHRATGSNVLILAPLAVAQQTTREAQSIGIAVNHARDAGDVKPGICITNYDRLHRFDTSFFQAVVCDESSIMKASDSMTRTLLIDVFAHTAYRLCCTATPAPNDFMELGSHAEFLGICTTQEMLSEYFVHDGETTQKWRLMGHAKQDFWRWVSSWGVMVKSPEDLGFDGSLYKLPALHTEEIRVASDLEPEDGELFPRVASTLMDRKKARRQSLGYRVAECAKLVNGIDDEPWLAWCELNSESEALAKAIPGAVEIKGSDTAEHKEKALLDFVAGRIRVLVTKPSVAGFGLNFQHCRRMAFVGVDDSYERYYQAIRRCYRFGQTREVYVHLFVSEAEGSVLANLKRKDRDASEMFEALRVAAGSAVKDEVLGNSGKMDQYDPMQDMVMPRWLGRSA